MTEVEAEFHKGLDVVRRQFLCCYPVKYIPFKKILKAIKWDEQKDLLDRTVHDSLNKEYPIKQKYQLYFLRTIIGILESHAQDGEVHDSIFEKFCSLQTAAESKDENDGFSFKHYVIPRSQSSSEVCITLKEQNSFVSNGTTGLCSWQASFALSEWLLHNQNVVQSKNVLELGSGTGFCGMVSFLCCNAERVLLTDGSPKVLELLNENLLRNIKDASVMQVENKFVYKTIENRSIETMILPWEEIENSNIHNVIKPDLILAADVVYNPSSFEALINAIDYIFNVVNNKCKMLLAATVRNDATLRDFIQLLDAKKLKAVEENYVCPTDLLFWDESTPIRIFSVNKSC